MNFILQARQVLFVVLCDWRHRRLTEIIEPGDAVGAVAGKIECRERLGGVLNYNYRKAA